jgi:hypothetical protein
MKDEEWNEEIRGDLFSEDGSDELVEENLSQLAGIDVCQLVFLKPRLSLVLAPSVFFFLLLVTFKLAPNQTSSELVSRSSIHINYQLPNGLIKVRRRWGHHIAISSGDYSTLKTLGPCVTCQEA